MYQKILYFDIFRDFSIPLCSIHDQVMIMLISNISNSHILKNHPNYYIKFGCLFTFQQECASWWGAKMIPES
jgi:hypothetical protein